MAHDHVVHPVPPHGAVVHQRAQRLRRASRASRMPLFNFNLIDLHIFRVVRQCARRLVGNEG